MARKSATQITKKQKKTSVEESKKTLSFFDYLRFGESYTSLILGIIVVIIATALLLSFVHNKNVSNLNTSINQQTQNIVQISQQANVLAKKEPSGGINTAASIGPTATIKPTAVPIPTKSKSMVKPTVATKNMTKTSPVQTKISQIKTDNDHNVWIVQKNESLWVIAEKKYTSGYNWIDISKANNLVDPSNIHVGDRLVLPSVTPKESTIATIQVTVTPTLVQQSTDSGMSKITGSIYIVIKGDNLWNIAVRAYGNGYKWIDIVKANNLANPGMIFSGNKLIIPRG
ncbi:MAG TPA: LysM peptidoglycan-binding domain-containing protein [Candidatus Sulfotelmatobacter sp.]|jgi:nucleoid-associated protein YgaU|nr:LysM peptidoglycan-binding domain-containing protein [Candidatus Sulfotelmatobacter sp.]